MTPRTLGQRQGNGKIEARTEEATGRGQIHPEQPQN